MGTGWGFKGIYKSKIFLKIVLIFMLVRITGFFGLMIIRVAINNTFIVVFF